jgi:hypothetical protein
MVTILNQASDHAPAGRKPIRTVALGVRRAAALAFYGGYAGAAVLSHLSHTHHSATLAVAASVALAVAVASFAVLFLRTGYLTWGNAPDLGLDERQIAVRHRRYGQAYVTFVTLVFLAMLYDHIAADAGWWLPDRKLDAEWLFWGVWVFGMTLPSMLIAWCDRPFADEE